MIMDKNEFRQISIKVVGENGWQTNIAKQLGISPRTLRRYLHTGRIPKYIALAVQRLEQLK